MQTLMKKRKKLKTKGKNWKKEKAEIDSCQRSMT